MIYNSKLYTNMLQSLESLKDFGVPPFGMLPYAASHRAPVPCSSPHLDARQKLSPAAASCQWTTVGQSWLKNPVKCSWYREWGLPKIAISQAPKKNTTLGGVPQTGQLMVRWDWPHFASPTLSSIITRHYSTIVVSSRLLISMSIDHHNWLSWIVITSINHQYQWWIIMTTRTIRLRKNNGHPQANHPFSGIASIKPAAMITNQSWMIQHAPWPSRLARSGSPIKVWANLKDLSRTD